MIQNEVLSLVKSRDVTSMKEAAKLLCRRYADVRRAFLVLIEEGTLFQNSKGAYKFPSVANREASVRDVLEENPYVSADRAIKLAGVDEAFWSMLEEERLIARCSETNTYRWTQTTTMPVQAPVLCARCSCEIDTAVVAIDQVA